MNTLVMNANPIQDSKCHIKLRRKFFDAMAHLWIIRFLKHRIADKRILRLIAKWLKVGIIEDGRVRAVSAALRKGR